MSGIKLETGAIQCSLVEYTTYKLETMSAVPLPVPYTIVVVAVAVIVKAVLSLALQLIYQFDKDTVCVSVVGSSRITF